MVDSGTADLVVDSDTTDLVTDSGADRSGGRFWYD